MTKERLQQHIDNFNQMCSELGETARLTIYVKQKGTTENAWEVTVNKDTYIESATLVKSDIITIKKQ